MVLDAYFDDSGTHDQAGVTAVAGYLAPREAWQQLFEDAWRRFLALNNLPFFHMVDYENRAPKHYAGWGDARRATVVTDMVEIIGRSALLGVGVTVSRAHFDQVVDLLTSRLTLKQPYHLCAHFAMLAVSRWLQKRGWQEPVGCVFEEEPKATDDLKLGLGALNEALRWRELSTMGTTLYFAPKKKVVELQAADFLAYETYKQGLRNARLDDHPIRNSLVALLRDTRVEYRGMAIDEQTLARIAEALRERASQEGTTP